MMTVYIFCLCLGFFFALLSAVLSGLFGHLGGADGGGADAHVGDVGAGGDIGGADVAHADVGHGDVGAGDADAGHEVHLSPLSPTIISLFVAGFGATGIILKEFLPELNPAAGIPAALVGATGVGALAFYVFGKVFSLGGRSSAPTQAELIGLQAEVTTTIPVDGVGEICYVARGSRYTAPARALDTLEIKARTIVTIQRVSGTVFLVLPAKNVRSQ